MTASNIHSLREYVNKDVEKKIENPVWDCAWSYTVKASSGEISDKLQGELRVFFRPNPSMTINEECVEVISYECTNFCN